MTTAESIIFASILIVAVTAMGLAYQFRNPLWSIVSSIFWLLWAYLGFQASTSIWDFNFAVGFLGLLFMLASGWESYYVSKPPVETDDNSTETHSLAEYRKKRGFRPSRRNQD